MVDLTHFHNTHFWWRFIFYWLIGVNKDGQESVTRISVSRGLFLSRAWVWSAFISLLLAIPPFHFFPLIMKALTHQMTFFIAKTTVGSDPIPGELGICPTESVNHSLYMCLKFLFHFIFHLSYCLSEIL